MTIHIDYCEYPASPHWRIHAYTVDSDDATVRDANVAEAMVRSLIGDEDGEDAEFFAYGKPEDGVNPRFRIVIIVSNTHRNRSDYRIDYRRIGPTPLEVTRAAMECYADIKHNIKMAAKK